LTTLTTKEGREQFKGTVKFGAVLGLDGIFRFRGRTATEWRLIGDEGHNDEAYVIAQAIDEREREADAA
jgi:hypothetical protein